MLEWILRLWVQGFELELAGIPPRVITEDFPSFRDQPEVAAAELDRLPTLGKIHLFTRRRHLPDLRVCPSQLIANPDETRVAHDSPTSGGLIQLTDSTGYLSDHQYSVATWAFFPGCPPPEL